MLAQIPDIGLVASKTRAVDTALLARADADGLSVLRVADGVRLRVFESDQRDDQVALGVLRQILLLRNDVFQQLLVDFQLVAALLKGHAEHILVLHRSRTVIGIDLHHVVGTLTLRLENLQGFVRIAGGNDAVRNLAREKGSRLLVTHVGESNPVAVGGHTVRAAGTGVSRRDRRKLEIVDEINLLERVAHRHGHSRARRADVLEGRGSRKAGGFLQLTHELPTVERVEKVDIAGTAVEHLDRQFSAVLHENPGRLLIRVASVFEHQFLRHPDSSIQSNFLTGSCCGFPSPTCRFRDR